MIFSVIRQSTLCSTKAHRCEGYQLCCQICKPEDESACLHLWIIVGVFFAPITRWCTAWRCPLRRRGRSAALGRTVRDLGAGAVPSLCHTGRSAALVRTVRDLATGSSSFSLLESRSCPLGEEILGCFGSTGHPGRPQTTWSRLGIKRSIRGRGLEWTNRSCPPGGVRS
jgi:hypothetical protein